MTRLGITVCTIMKTVTFIEHILCIRYGYQMLYISSSFKAIELSSPITDGETEVERGGNMLREIK